MFYVLRMLSKPFTSHAVIVILMQYLLFNTCHAADYTGTDSCISCHQTQYQSWQGSHHDMSMRHANNESVLGNFNQVSVNHKGQTYLFYKKADEYWVQMVDADGQQKHYKISYTFGYTPLQQYMVEFNDGRIQLIPFAWDSRKKDVGGQRWFHLYPELDKFDEFYWTNVGQNWNFMCADCHSTNVKKRFDVSKNTYQSSWVDINVGCEACHGPASEHVNWSKLKQSEQQTDKTRGFDRDLSKRVKEWKFEQGSKILIPQQAKSTDLHNTCLQCHSRRTQISDATDHVKGDLLDRYLLSDISPTLYYPDGQIYDEVFVGGSFLQSKMHKAGVSCSDCHNPHSAQLVLPKENLCFQCHLHSEYGLGKHSKHQANTEADDCVTCHMPKTLYMQIDARADHSFSIPRPDLSKLIGSPNVCSVCHEDKSNDWSIRALTKWYPDSKLASNPFAISFFGADNGNQSSANELAYIAQNPLETNIIRASAISRLAQYPSQNALITLARSVKHQDSLIRLSTIDGSANFRPQDRFQILEPLLSDSVLGVRIEAAGALALQWQGLTVAQRHAIEKPLKEYIDFQQFNGDRGFAHTNIGNIYRSKGLLDKAEESYLTAINIEPIYSNSYVNLADLYRERGNEEKSFAILMKGMKAQPKAGSLPYSAGLSLYRQNKLTDAILYFKQATMVESQNGQYWYVLALAQEKVNSKQAILSMRKAYEVSHNPEHLYALCELTLRYNDKSSDQCIKQLTPFVPENIIRKLQQKMN